MRWTLAQVLTRCLHWSGAGRALRGIGTWRGTLVLNYHRIGDGTSSRLDRGLWSANTEQLGRQLAFLTRNFDVVGPEELLCAVRAERGRRVLITFDDGYRDLYSLAFPVLEANRVRATFFLCSGFIDGVAHAWWDELAWMMRAGLRPVLAPGPWSPDPLSLVPPGLDASIAHVNSAYRALQPALAEQFLEALAEATGAGRRPPQATDWITWEMAREMRAAGHEIGAHTVNHPLLSRLSAEGQRNEILGSLDRIEAELGERPRWFAYPVGLPDTFTAHTESYVREAGVELAFSNYGGYVAAGLRPFDVPRIGVGPTLDGAPLYAALTLPQVLARRSARAQARAVRMQSCSS